MYVYYIVNELTTRCPASEQGSKRCADTSTRAHMPNCLSMYTGNERQTKLVRVDPGPAPVFKRA